MYTRAWETALFKELADTLIGLTEDLLEFLATSKVWEACVFQNAFARFGLAKLSWHVLDEVCCGSGPASCLAWVISTLGWGDFPQCWKLPLDMYIRKDSLVKEVQVLLYFQRKRLNWSSWHLQMRKSGFNVLTSKNLSNSTEKCIWACPFTMG